MRMRQLGNSGLFVSELCLGTMTFCQGRGAWSHIAKVGQSDAEALVKASLDAGINFIDTANIYSQGESETILGKAVKSLGVRRDDVVIATKVMGQMGEGPNGRGTSRAHILSQAKASLKRLGVDHIDLYQIHGFDRSTPMLETLEALDTLVRQGDVRYIGLSNWAAWQVMKAVGIAEARRLAPILSLQAYYTLVGRDLEREIIPMLMAENIGLMVWSPLAGGILTGKYDAEGKTADGRRTAFDFPPVDMPRSQAAIAAMRDIAKAKDCTVAQVALAWLLHQDVVTSVIIGATRMDQLNDNIASTEVKLGADDLAALDAVTRLPSEYPGWMFERQGSARPENPRARRS